jgi:ATP-dependent DNA ligase
MKALFKEIKKHDLEGIVVKRADAPYTTGGMR